LQAVIRGERTVGGTGRRNIWRAGRALVDLVAAVAPPAAGPSLSDLFLGLPPLGSQMLMKLPVVKPLSALGLCPPRLPEPASLASAVSATAISDGDPRTSKWDEQGICWGLPGHRDWVSLSWELDGQGVKSLVNGVLNTKPGRGDSVETRRETERTRHLVTLPLIVGKKERDVARICRKNMSQEYVARCCHMGRAIAAADSPSLYHFPFPISHVASADRLCLLCLHTRAPPTQSANIPVLFQRLQTFFAILQLQISR